MRSIIFFGLVPVMVVASCAEPRSKAETGTTQASVNVDAGFPYETIALYDQLFSLNRKFAEASMAIIKAYDDPSVDGDEFLFVADNEIPRLNEARQGARDLNLDAAIPGTASDIRDVTDGWASTYLMADALRTAVRTDADTQISFRTAIGNSALSAIDSACVVQLTVSGTGDGQLLAVIPIHYSVCTALP